MVRVSSKDEYLCGEGEQQFCSERGSFSPARGVHQTRNLFLSYTGDPAGDLKPDAEVCPGRNKLYEEDPQVQSIDTADHKAHGMCTRYAASLDPFLLSFASIVSSGLSTWSAQYAGTAPSTYRESFHNHCAYLQAHDEKDTCNIGDTVRVYKCRYCDCMDLSAVCNVLWRTSADNHVSCRPLSKRKHFMVTEIMTRARIFDEKAAARLTAAPDVRPAATVQSATFATSALR